MDQEQDIPDVNKGFFVGLEEAKVINMRKFPGFKEARAFILDEVISKGNKEITHMFKRNDMVVILWHSGKQYCSRCVTEHKNLFKINK